MCPYCSVSCGVLIYTTGDKSKNAKADIIHIEGDPDNPVNRGTLCPKGAGLLDMVKSPNRLKFPEVREPGSNEWKRISWDEAINAHRQAHEGRPRRQLHREERRRRHGQPLEHHGFLASSAANNEAGYITVKVLRSLGASHFDTQARI
jgi:formate dehydrogenase major subunit